MAARVMHPFLCQLCMPFRGFIGLSRDPSQLNFFLSLPHAEASATTEDVCVIHLDIYS